MKELQQNNPLHGVKLEVLLDEIVAHYGWETLAFAMNMNCFKNNPNTQSCLKFLRKTQWAREKVEAFYLYRFKHLPRPDDKQYALPPRDRIVPADQKPRAPVVIDITAKPQLQNKPKPRSRTQAKTNYRAKVAAKPRHQENDSATEEGKPFDPWAASPK
ncbi:VF530 family protein [Agarivorans sp. TSD2052]|uniref:VF530 family protein n=1 Tax=Agarivorans sp. TSD2052 TaxID=2937286 RepID=UPI00200D88AE|nr:VF530 family DNA-binding protein [Agarivorans sp. TSD2052]UPW19702.1 VF530 family protein [Agarivorans sp. TSD2052]